jgi:hypothetical protein
MISNRDSSLSSIGFIDSDESAASTIDADDILRYDTTLRGRQDSLGENTGNCLVGGAKENIVEEGEGEEQQQQHQGLPTDPLHVATTVSLYTAAAPTTTGIRLLGNKRRRHSRDPACSLGGDDDKNVAEDGAHSALPVLRPSFVVNAAADPFDVSDPHISTSTTGRQCDQSPNLAEAVAATTYRGMRNDASVIADSGAVANIGEIANRKNTAAANTSFVAAGGGGDAAETTSTMMMLAYMFEEVSE